jgi:hypothetical protein
LGVWRGAHNFSPQKKEACSENAKEASDIYRKQISILGNVHTQRISISMHRRANKLCGYLWETVARDGDWIFPRLHPSAAYKIIQIM